jgi:RimJ/RimL family protein N-acetyltransferase
MIFETERLIVRKLILSDLNSFHEMQSNPNVMMFAEGAVKNLDEHYKELTNLIKKYSLKNNDFLDLCY